MAGGLVWLLLVSMYASDIGLFQQLMIGWIWNLCAIASGSWVTINDMPRSRVAGRWTHNVSSSNIHGLLEQVMLEHNEAGVNLAGITDDLLPVLKNLLNSDGAACDTVI